MAPELRGPVLRLRTLPLSPVAGSALGHSGTAKSLPGRLQVMALLTVTLG